LDRLLDIIYGLQRDILVSLPANDGIEIWLDSNNINGLMASESPTFKVVNWWCSFGSGTSQQMFVDFVTKYPNLHHVCVFNLGITSAVPNWDRFDPLPALDKLSQAGKVKIANILPWLADPAILEEVDLGTPLHEIVKNGYGQKQLNPIVKWKTIFSRVDSLTLKTLSQKNILVSLPDIDLQKLNYTGYDRQVLSCLIYPRADRSTNAKVADLLSTICQIQPYFHYIK
jgi:hypothetical protein